MTTEQLKQLEADLWRAADNLRANSDLKASEYSTPVLGLIFLRFADNIYSRYESEIDAEHARLKKTRISREMHDIAIEKCGFYLPPEARYRYLLELPEEDDVATAIKEAMEAIERYKPELQGILPKEEYFRLTRNPKTRTIPNELLKNFADIPADAGGDLFGQIYEYFLSNFALAEGQGGGEFFTPRSVVRLMVEIIEPHHGTVFDPACGSGGMFVQSAHFVERRRGRGGADGADDLYVFGQEKTLETAKLAKMNLAVNGLRGEITQANTYYEDAYPERFGTYDYVLANPPFNVDDVAVDQVEKDRRFNAYGIPRNKTKGKSGGKESVPNANYLWINLFASALKPGGRAALVMANSASDARHSEAEIRRRLIEENLIDAMLTLPSNMFYTVTLPATLWFFDKGKRDDRILFIDARNIFTPIDRAHREFSPEQIENIALIARLRRGNREAFIELVDTYFAAGMERLTENYEGVDDVAGQFTLLMNDADATAAVDALVAEWDQLAELRLLYDAYEKSRTEMKTIDVDAVNDRQRRLRERFDPFFATLHDGLKRLDRIVRADERRRGEAALTAGRRGGADRATKDLKASLEQLHAEVRDAETFYAHIRWLQERFPRADYDDVTGLCKLASQEEIAEQDYSLNPGRYVGVVIEEDGRSEEEFAEELFTVNEQLHRLNSEAYALQEVISSNVQSIIG